MVKEELKMVKSKKEIDTTGGSLACFSQTPKVNADHTKTLKSRKRNQAHVQSSTLERAEKIKASLNPKFPVLVKYMLPSHVSSCFWLGLPLEFCKSYLPKRDEMMTLITDNGEEYSVKFLVQKTGFSGGWRAFSILNKLVEGDVVVFHLIEATKFKAYIIRNSKLAEVDASIELLNLNALGRQTDTGKIGKTKTFQRKRLKSLPVSITQENYGSTSPPVSDVDLALPLEQAGNDSEEIDSHVKESIKLTESIVEFKDIRDVEGFSIMVNGLVIDSQIPKFVKNKYYGLCCSQHAFLHKYLPRVLNRKLVAGMISETVNIADAIAASKLTTSQKDFLIWDKSLGAFDQLGMNVGFLRSRLHRLMNLASKSEQVANSKRYGEALLEQSQVKEEMRNIELKLSELRETFERFGKEIATLKEKTERHELKFLAEASAPW